MFNLCSMMILKMIVISLYIHHFISTSNAAPTSEVHSVDEFQLDDNFSNDDEVEFLLDDMILSREQMDELFQPTTRKNGVKNLENLWPNKTIPFLISQKFKASQREKLLHVLEIISTKSCIKFEELSENTNFSELSGYVHVLPGNRECSANVGFSKGIHLVKLDVEGCLDDGRILHEFLHILGFFHMHTTVNRDDYVTIKWDNIKPDFFANFEPFENDLTLLGTPYDYDSITHYSTNSFSKNGLQTIISKTPDADKIIGQRTHLSEGDINRINRLYNC